METKTCAIVLRHIAGVAQVLMFRHPLAGVQLVKGGIKNGETPTQAALRELFEESGLTATSATHLKTMRFEGLNQSWHICLCAVDDTQDTWVHDTLDDDGQRFAFFWHPTGSPLPADTGAAYRDVIQSLQSDGQFSD